MSELSQYDYVLPRELIAQQPLAQRSDARLMVVNRRTKSIEHRYIRDLPDLLGGNDALVLNDTRVIPARLVGKRDSTEGRWSGLYLDSDPSGRLRLIGKTRGKLQADETISLFDRDARPAATLRLLAKLDDGSWVAAPEPAEPPLELLERVGRVPLPHYIREGEMVDADVESYQTVFADKPGSVAAPTAGLHFTPNLLRSIAAKGVGVGRVTLHVGLGTFRPITAERLQEHHMHAEVCELPAETADMLNMRRSSGGRVVAVGTTSVRVLETVADDVGRFTAWKGETRLFIRPPYRFYGVDALLTNFHLPKSTLLVLVRTFGGDELIRRAYAEAIAEQYRFYSYGDGMLIL